MGDGKDERQPLLQTDYKAVPNNFEETNETGKFFYKFIRTN